MSKINIVILNFKDKKVILDKFIKKSALKYIIRIINNNLYSFEKKKISKEKANKIKHKIGA